MGRCNVNSTQVLRKLDAKVARRRAELTAELKRIKRSKDKHGLERCMGELKRLNRRTISGLTYGIRSNEFSNARGTTGYNPETERAHSYSWYSLAQRIKGVMILNTYHYSSQTGVHIGRVGKVLRDLGVKYQRLQAPRGLQDLDAALAYELETFASCLVRQKYSRGQKHSAEYFVDRMRSFQSRELRLLAKLGFKTTRKMRDAALASAEQDRLDRNAFARERAARRRKAAAVVIVSDYANKLHRETDGIHVTKTADWSWDLETKTVHDTKHCRRRSTFQWERERAVREGLNKIYVHSGEARHLEVVS